MIEDLLGGLLEFAAEVVFETVGELVNDALTSVTERHKPAQPITRNSQELWQTAQSGVEHYQFLPANPVKRPVAQQKQQSSKQNAGKKIWRA